MAITSAICSTFKKELMTATHNFTTTSGNTMRVALIKAQGSQTGTYNATTTSYTTITGNSDELANGNGYTTKGNTLTNVTPTNGTSTTTTALTDFADTSWTSATFTTRGCVIYNDSASGDPAVMVIDFGADYSVAGGTFTIQFPTADESNAILRIT